MKKNHGFTLIELMIVIAIIGILSAIAVPAYRDYTRKAYIAEGLALAGMVKQAIAVYNATNGGWRPEVATNEAIGLPPGDKITGQAVNSVWTVWGPSGRSVTPIPGAALAHSHRYYDRYPNIIITYNGKVTGHNSSARFPLRWQAGYAINPDGSAQLGNALILAPVIYEDIDTGVTEWVCVAKGNEIPLRLLPANCRTQGLHQIPPMRL